jgi:hypothetical protein
MDLPILAIAVWDLQKEKVLKSLFVSSHNGLFR